MAVDYYKILEISPAADAAEIKAAYRRLAHQYHPDKNPENQSTDAHFALIKEAYEILSHPASKEKYLQQRWLSKAYGRDFTPLVITPEDLLRQVLSVGDTIHHMDIYRMHTEAVRQDLARLVAPERIQMLNDFNETAINDAIVQELLQLILVLPAPKRADFYTTLLLIQSSYHAVIQQEEEALSAKLFWEAWRPAFVLLLVVLLCILIWGTSLKY